MAGRRARLPFPSGCLVRREGAFPFFLLSPSPSFALFPSLHSTPSHSTAFTRSNAEEIPLRPGMVFTIEPMLLELGPEIDTWSDGWTVVAQDGGRGGQFEHTVLITEEGVEVLTVPE